MKSINYNSNPNKSKSTYVNLQKEEEEDKELLDLLEGKRKIKYFYNILIAYTSHSNRTNCINEVIVEEDEDKNNLNKENDTKKENLINNKNIINNNNKFKKILPKNDEINNNIKVINENIIKNKNEAQNKNKSKSNTIWGYNPSPFNKKLNTYENLFYKKTFDKYISLRDKLIPENKNEIILPDLKKSTNSNNPFENIKRSLNSKMILRSISTDKAKLQQNMNINSITNNDTSAFTHSSKKHFPMGGIGNQNYTEDLSKFRMGLLSAGSTSNNNIIIPMMPMRRPVSNFNFGGGQLWNNFENNNKNIVNKAIDINEEKNKNINNNLRKKEEGIIFDAELNKKEINMDNPGQNYNNIYDKFSNNLNKSKSLKGQDLKKQYDSFPLTNDINNLYIGMDKMISKLHKIKIEKGMMSSSIVNSLNKKFNNDYQSQIEQFKKSHLPMMFNNQNNKGTKPFNVNNDKNKSTRSHSLNNRNNIY